MAAGNYRDDALFNIVLTSTNNLPGIVAEAVPMLHIQPVHPLLSIGSTNLPASCTGFVPQKAGPDTWVNKNGAAAEPTQPDAAAADAAAAVDVAESAQVEVPSELVPAAPVEEIPVEPDAAAYAAHLAGLRAKQAAAAAAAATAAAAAAAGGGGPTAAATMDAASAAATRQLLQSSSSSSDSSDSMVGSLMDWQQEGEEDAGMQQQGRHLLAGEAVTVPASYRLQYSLNGSTPVDTGDISVMAMPFQRITLSGLKNYPDVSHYSSIHIWLREVYFNETSSRYSSVRWHSHNALMYNLSITTSRRHLYWPPACREAHLLAAAQSVTGKQPRNCPSERRYYTMWVSAAARL
jgi:hypothetical protein